MPTPTTTDNTIRINADQVNQLHRYACAHMRPTRHDDSVTRVDCLVPWELANLYVQAGAAVWNRNLRCEQVEDAAFGYLAHITGEI